MIPMRVGVRIVARAPAAQIRCFGVEDVSKSWNRRETANEESYFNKVEYYKRKELDEPIQRKELGSLFSILGENHRLSEEQIHSLLEWKHGKMDYISDYQVDTIDDAAKKTQE